jgi:ABC-type bacteriocin/lantibiotic exporter with double-glycine peptidase domain
MNKGPSMAAVYLDIDHVRQWKDGECLAACAAMVLNFINFPVAYNKLLRTLEIKDEFGTPSSKVRNLERMGVHVIYQRGDLDVLRKYLGNDQPCIVFVNTGELPYWETTVDHAVVVAGMDEKYIYLNDPDLPEAPVSVPIGDFDLAWLEHDEMYAVLTI